MCLHYKDFLGLTFLFDLRYKWNVERVKLQLISDTNESNKKTFYVVRDCLQFEVENVKVGTVYNM